MSDSSTLKRQLTIKTGVVKRLTKEEQTYLVEAQRQEARVQKLRSDFASTSTTSSTPSTEEGEVGKSKGDVEWELKNQERVLLDCLQMVPDCRRRLEVAVEDLTLLMDTLADDVELAAMPEAQAAKTALEAAAASAAKAETTVEAQMTTTTTTTT